MAKSSCEAKCVKQKGDDLFKHRLEFGASTNLMIKWREIKTALFSITEDKIYSFAFNGILQANKKAHRKISEGLK